MNNKPHFGLVRCLPYNLLILNIGCSIDWLVSTMWCISNNWVTWLVVVCALPLFSSHYIVNIEMILVVWLIYSYTMIINW